MVAEVMSFAVNNKMKELILQEAKQKNKTVSKIIGERISATKPLSETASDTIERFATAFKVKQSQIMDILIIDFAAKQAAEIEAFGRSLFDTNPFVFDTNAKMLVGDELFRFLRKAYSREILTDDCLVKKAKSYNDERKRELEKHGE